MDEQRWAASPVYTPASAELPWWRRASHQGMGYVLPSTIFLVLPVVAAARQGVGTFAAVTAASFTVLVFYLGSSLVTHWAQWARWLWLLGLICSICLLAAASNEPTTFSCFSPFMTIVTAGLLPWRSSRLVVIGLALGAAAIAMLPADPFAIAMSMMAFAVGWSMSMSSERAAMRAQVQRAEERTAILAVTAERARIGRDLHDILGHSLTAIAIKADLIDRLIGRDAPAAHQEVAALAQIARQALADVRATATGMRHVRLASEVASARSVLLAAGVEFGAPSALPVMAEAPSELFGYVVREAITNVVRHAEARTCTLTADENSVTISDDGRGIPSDVRRTGLDGLADRVEAAGGTLAVSSSSTGTTIRAELPREAT